MTPETAVPAPSKKSDKPDKSEPLTDLLSEAPAVTLPEPPPLAPGQSVKHANGEIYTIAAIHAAGILLEGVANLVPAADLTLA